jgi:hypothetical protein
MGAPLPFREIAAHALARSTRADTLRSAVTAAADARGLPRARLAELRLFSDASVVSASSEWVAALAHHPPEAIGALSEALLALERGRRQTGSFYTPRSITEHVVRSALEHTPATLPRTCDPALGGGAFLIECGRQLAARSGLSRRQIAERCLFGADIDPLAVAVAEAVLWLWVDDAELSPLLFRDRLLVTDALEQGWEPRDLDLVIGNPPWIAYAGRAAQPLEKSLRRDYAKRFRAFRGYPTLHGLFVERATQIGAHATIALLLPSPVADLEGYRPVRAALGRTHAPIEPLLELGQDAFDGVTQPCFSLIARPAVYEQAGRAWVLSERQRAHTDAARVIGPPVLDRLLALPKLPRALFGEMGFQSAGDVSKRLFLRADRPDAVHTVPLLEGREVQEFRAGTPRLFLRPDPDVLAAARCRLRPSDHYRRVAFVVRQTARYPIAALHTGVPFRNTLLAGFACEDLSPELMVALLNSTLYRALHLVSQRDARQAVFPQVKIAHLRALPRPPHDASAWARLCRITERASASGMSEALRAELDQAVFGLFEVGASDADAVIELVRARR